MLFLPFTQPFHSQISPVISLIVYHTNLKIKYNFRKLGIRSTGNSLINNLITYLLDIVRGDSVLVTYRSQRPEVKWNCNRNYRQKTKLTCALEQGLSQFPLLALGFCSPQKERSHLSLKPRLQWEIKKRHLICVTNQLVEQKKTFFSVLGLKEQVYSALSSWDSSVRTLNNTQRIGGNLMVILYKTTQLRHYFYYYYFFCITSLLINILILRGLGLHGDRFKLCIILKREIVHDIDKDLIFSSCFITTICRGLCIFCHLVVLLAWLSVYLLVCLYVCLLFTCRTKNR